MDGSLRMPRARSAVRLAQIALVCAWMTLSAAFAHHTFSMFDMQHRKTLHGTVRELQWTNPHCFLQVLVPRDAGATQEWSIQMGPPLDLYRKGWRPAMLKAGDPVTVIIHPTRDGSSAGSYVSGTGPDGKALPED